MEKNNNYDAFFSLLRAGLWERDVCIPNYESIDWDVLFQLADEQSIVGLIAAGLEHVRDRKVKKTEAIPFLKKVVSLEQRNKLMNDFIASMVASFRNYGIYSLLLKGQGIAQCYERPEWRSSGDIDFLLDDLNYQKAKKYLVSIASFVDKEDYSSKHLGMTIDSWSVEIHGTFHNNLSTRSNKVVDKVQFDCLSKGNVRAWRNGEIDVFLPSPNNDAVFVFSHILQHFFRGGIGLRQVCDWCRLLWTYKDSIDISLLRSRLHEMRHLSEWKAFAVFAVDYLGMPPEAMPFYDSTWRWKIKAKQIAAFILDVGNFGQKRDKSYYEKYPYLVYKIISLGRNLGDSFRHMLIFPLDSFCVMIRMLIVGFSAVSKGR